MINLNNAITLGRGNNTYLRLDCSNDPLTDSLIITKLADGADVNLTIRNTAAVGSSNETVSIIAQTTTTPYPMGKIVFGRADVYDIGGTQESFMDFYTTYDGGDVKALRIDGIGNFNFQGGWLTGIGTLSTTGTIYNYADDSKHAFGAGGATDSYIQFGGTNLEYYSSGTHDFLSGNIETLGTGDFGSPLTVTKTGTGSTFVANRTDGAALGLQAGLTTAVFAFDVNYKFAIASNARAGILSGSLTPIFLLTVANKSTLPMIQIGRAYGTNSSDWTSVDHPQVVICGVDNEATVEAFRIQDENQREYFSVSSTGGGATDDGKVDIAGFLTIAGTIKSANYQSGDGSAGIDTTFLDQDGNTITIKDGLVTAKTAP